MSEFVLERIVVPPTLAEAESGVIADMVRIGNASARRDSGTEDLDDTVEEVFAQWSDTSDFVHAGFIARRDGEVLGVATLQYLVHGEATADIDVWIDPPAWGQGVEQVLLAEIEAEAVRHGRRTVHVYTLHRPDSPGPRLQSPTGFGEIGADDRQTRLYADAGYTLGQVERQSAFDLTGPVDGVQRMLADAEAAAGTDYRVLTWTTPTPEHLLDGFAKVRARLSQDMPAGELAVEDDPWDADRVRRREERFAAMGLTVSIAAVQHVPTGDIVAYNDIGITTAEPGSPTRQFGTLVVPEHRGHHLGVIVKCANLLRWRDIAPQSPRISTFNAEENAHMLRINVAIGFRPVSYVGAWQKELT